ncbi:hypothetical protein [uncultured Litoreibacter sp.]|uniref:hypothetical protein n=1 Tax=uncultured Litoreibacter sp. TaxID=1392394 RepID=UPI0026067653|nr:hypothetical protein [uncultured Litoreibacter sp.]
MTELTACADAPNGTLASDVIVRKANPMANARRGRRLIQLLTCIPLNIGIAIEAAILISIEGNAFISVNGQVSLDFMPPPESVKRQAADSLSPQNRDISTT